MNFYYDPILGLQYDFIGCGFAIDIDSIPKEFTAIQYLSILKEKSLDFIGSGYFFNKGVQVIWFITNYKL